eukprot:c13229_g1_i2.p1 GENE.c13229_g1_i2~~c13229_g1_i2.p1  ORF type:complete len:168 (+),score=19.68 c13229_g1_i2:162-665(+)
MPPSQDKREWLAVMADNFTNECMILREEVACHFCTEETCQVMAAGDYKFLWQDPGQKPMEISAPQYTSKCLDWILGLLEDENFFPQEEGRPFPKDFEKRVKKIYQRLVRIYAHWYRNHIRDFDAAGALAHLNTCFRHLYLFCQTQKLIDDKDMEPIREEIRVIVNGS